MPNRTEALSGYRAARRTTGAPASAASLMCAVRKSWASAYASALLLALLLLESSASLHAQALPSGWVTGTVRNELGNVLSDVRVRVAATGLDTVVRTNSRGAFSLWVPEGPARFTLTRIGYSPNAGDVTITKSQAIQMQMRALPQTLAAVNVREDWIGIRGVVGDDSTMDLLRGVTIKSMKRSIKVTTDSQGRFEFSLPRQERTSLTLSRDGYLTKPFVVPMDSAKSADVTVLMTRGNDPIRMKYALIDLEHRLAWGGSGMFVLDNAKLFSTGSTYVGDAIGRSGMLVRKGIILGAPGVFVDGQPSTSDVLGQIRVADVELVEVWDRDVDITRTLASRWPGGSASHKGGGPWIAVWRKR